VPRFITRCDDDVSKTSALTDPDVAAARLRGAGSSESPMLGTVAEGFPAGRGASRSGASGASVAETVDEFWSSFRYNLDALLDVVLQFLPCSGVIKDAVDLELEVDEKFALDFQTVRFATDLLIFRRRSILCFSAESSSCFSSSSICLV
jgi:hypothetical protein